MKKSKALHELEKFRNEIEKLLPSLSEQLGVSLSLGKGRYDASNGSFSLSIDGVIAGGYSPDESIYNQIRIFESNKNLPDLGTEFVYKFDTYRIIGSNSRGTKIKCRNLKNNRVYLFPTEYINLMFKK